MRFLMPLSLASLMVVGSLDAQVRGRVVVGGGPVSAAVVFGDSYRRPAPRVVYVEDWRGPRGRGNGWWSHAGFRRIEIYRDRDGYYDRWYDGRPNLVKVVVYERGGHYYDSRWFDDRYDGRYDGRYGYDNRRVVQGRWDDRRWDDRRWDDRRWDGRRNDDRWDDRRDRDRDDHRDRDDDRGRGRQDDRGRHGKD